MLQTVVFFLLLSMVIILCVQTQASDIHISEESVTWGSATSQCKQLFMFKEAERVNLLKKTIQSGEEFWIGARANLIKFVAWDGCVKERYGGITPHRFHLGYDNSIAKCSEKCSQVVADCRQILLQGEYCLVASTNYISSTTEPCNISCPGNINDRCGGTGTRMSLYTTDLGDTYKYETQRDIEKRCLAFISQDKYKAYPCDSTDVTGYLLMTDYYRPTKNISPLTWEEAAEKANKQGRFGYVLPRGIRFDNNIHYWTSMRRSSSLVWGNTPVDGYPLCVAVKLTNQTFSISEQSCNNQHRFICADDTKLPWVTIGLALLFTVLAITVFGGLCWWRRRKARQRSASFENTTYGQIIPSTSCKKSKAAGRSTKRQSNQSSSNPNIYNTVESMYACSNDRNITDIPNTYDSIAIDKDENKNKTITNERKGADGKIRQEIGDKNVYDTTFMKRTIPKCDNNVEKGIYNTVGETADTVYNTLCHTKSSNPSHGSNYNTCQPSNIDTYETTQLKHKGDNQMSGYSKVQVDDNIYNVTFQISKTNRPNEDDSLYNRLATVDEACDKNVEQENSNMKYTES